MPFDAPFPLLVHAERPWMTRRPGECAFPTRGESVGVWSCCSPCGSATYCEPHSVLMRGPRAPSPDAVLRELSRIIG